MPHNAPTVLVIEDDAVIATDICRCLTREGFSVVGPAADCLGALRLAATTPIDLVLADITLTGDLDGITAARELCDGRRRIIIMTADMARAATEAIGLADGFLSKPFVRADLLSALAEAGVSAAGLRPPANQQLAKSRFGTSAPAPRTQSASGS